MKYRLTYVFAFILALVTSLAFSALPSVSAVLTNVFSAVSSVSIFIGVCFTMFFVVLTTTGSVASLRRRKAFAKTFFKTAFWGIIATIIALALAYVVAAYIMPLAFTSSNAGAITADAIAESEELVKGLNVPKLVTAYLQNGSVVEFLSFGMFQGFVYFYIFLAIIAAYFLGFFLKPDVEVIRPLYVFYNANTELGYRIGNFLVRLYNILIFFIAGYWFSVVMKTQLLKQAMWLVLIVAAFALVFMLVVLPIMYLIGIRFKRKNVVSMWWSAFSLGLTSFFTGNVLFTLTEAELVARQENDVPKKYVSSMMPLLTIFSRVGLASISYILALLIVNFSGATLSAGSYIILALCCFGLSCVLGFLGGTEVVFTTILSLGAVGIADVSVLPLFALAPIMQSISCFMDTATMFYGACSLGTYDELTTKKA